MHLGALPAEFAVALHVGADAGVGEHGIEFGEAQRETLKLLTEGLFHRDSQDET